MSIVGFVSAGFMVLAGLAAGAVGIASGNAEALAVLIVYPILGMLYVFPSLYLFQFASAIRAFTVNPGERELESALDAQRRFWKFVGILTAVSIAIGVVGMVVLIVVAIAAGAMLGR